MALVTMDVHGCIDGKHYGISSYGCTWLYRWEALWH